jgi:plastocyanin
MKAVFVLVTLLGFFARAAWADATIEGRVELPKSQSAPVVVKRYEITTKGGVVAPNPPVAVVYLEGTFPKAAQPPVAQMLQKDLLFSPALLPIQVGTKVEFPNMDDTYHNVFSYSPTKRFDLGRYRPDEKPVPSQIFEKPGLVTLRCDIHEHMRGAILVLDTPYFVMTDTDGAFKLSGLPAGNFKLKAWINSKKTVEIPVTLSTNSTLRVNLP